MLLIVRSVLLGLVLPNAGGDLLVLAKRFVAAARVGSALATTSAFTAFAMIREQDVG